MDCNRHHQASFAIALGLVLALAVVAATPAQAGYRLPWKAGKSYSVTQGWDSTPSHSGSQEYAYDFALPEGTAIYAAQAGWVTHVKKNGNACGGQEHVNDANYVVIKHFDGKATLYLHMKYQGVWVSTGQWVNRGQFLGWSGSTGWTDCGAHLHFQRQNQGGWFTQSSSIYFDEYPNQELDAGSSYTSSNN